MALPATSFNKIRFPSFIPLRRFMSTTSERNPDQLANLAEMFNRDKFTRRNTNWFADLTGIPDGFETSDIRDLLEKHATPEALAYLNSMSDEDLNAVTEEYWKALDDYKGTDAFRDWVYDAFYGEDEYLDVEQLLHHLSQLGDAPMSPDPLAYRRAAEKAIAAENAKILKSYDEALARRTESYEDELSGIRADYRDARSGILTRQNMQNAQLMDSMQSQLDKQRRNALEAGASAGIRLAGNINTLLSTQNKQSQQSIETSNQLAQMMLNQRSAERSARSSYDDYMQSDLNNRTALKLGTQGRVDAKYNSEYGTAMDAYSQNKVNWDNAYDSNHLRDSYYNYKQKSQYQGASN